MFRRTALAIAASLAQIGESSFISPPAGLDVLERGRDLILAGAILSILANPLFFVVLDRLRPWLERCGGAATWWRNGRPACPFH